MNLDQYQERAVRTDQNPRVEAAAGSIREPKRSEIIPLLGLVGEVGSLLGEYKKLLRDGATHRKFRDEVAEELGDILWYVANVANKFDLRLSDIATQNLEKVEDRWLPVAGERKLYDGHLPTNQQLPRAFAYDFETRSDERGTTVWLVDRIRGKQTGNTLTDNAYEDDGYRYHDVLHLAFAACLGWSPVVRKLLRKSGQVEKRQPSEVDEVEDGGRSQVIEEAIVAAAYAYGANHEFLEGIDAVDWQLLRHIKQLTAHLEVRNRTAKEWNDSLILGFAVWRKLRAFRGGTVRGDLLSGTLEFESGAVLPA